MAAQSAGAWGGQQVTAQSAGAWDIDSSNLGDASLSIMDIMGDNRNDYVDDKPTVDQLVHLS